MDFSFLSTIETKDWAIVFSTLIGPILAVQAQKFVEQFKIKNQRKNFIFEQLMATRGARLSREHVTALNMIDLVFYGSIFWGKPFRTKSEKRVLESWKEYLDHLCVTMTDDPHKFSLWSSKGEELFINLLFAVATDLKFSFDRVQLKNSAYAPIGHHDLENEQAQLRRSMINVLEGNTSLKMNIDKLNLN